MTGIDPEGLEFAFNRVNSHKLTVTIMPQMDETRPWCVEVELPVFEGSQHFYFTDKTLVGALNMALDEYSRRRAAISVLQDRPQRGIPK